MLLVGDAHRPYERPALSKEFLAGRRDELDLSPAIVLGRQGSRASARHAGPSTSVFASARWAGQRRAGTAGTRWSYRDPGPARTTAQALLDRPRGRPQPARPRADADRLRPPPGDPVRRLAVVGAGFVGTEVASTATALGVPT